MRIECTCGSQAISPAPICLFFCSPFAYVASKNLQPPRVAAEAEVTRVVTWLTDAITLFTPHCTFSSNIVHLYLERVLYYVLDGSTCEVARTTVQPGEKKNGHTGHRHAKRHSLCCKYSSVWCLVISAGVCPEHLSSKSLARHTKASPMARIYHPS